MSTALKAIYAAGLAMLVSIASPAFAMSHAAGADRDHHAEEWVQTIANDATVMLANPETTADQITSEFQALLAENVALRNFGRSALGPYVRSISDDDFDLYVALLEQYATSVVQSRLSEYTGETILVDGSSVDERTNFAYVNVESDILNQHGEVLAAVRWLLIRRGEDYRVYDLTVETTDESATFSMLQTQREEFNSVLSGNGGRIEALLDYLRGRIREAGAEPAN